MAVGREMAEMQVLSAGLRAQPDWAASQRNILEEQVELWWFRDPRRSLLCFCFSVALVLGCGAGGVGLLYSTGGPSGEWRLGMGMVLCLLSLAVLLKQLLSSAVQDTDCVRSWSRIAALKSGGTSDLAVGLLAGLTLLVCGAVLLRLAPAAGPPRPGSALNDMFVTGAALTAAGGATALAVAVYAAAVFLPPVRGLRAGVAAIFTTSGRMREARSETVSSMINLL
ncbi:transmembrane protein 125-like [Megalops cyprinoides]|uniref:transmembrane protein 125-like n=1 Tax=Megalops cyprinoides TaxID=118141 RepID=UPI001864C8D9|nr:transmembrane protein 125-like [Megalops cyprinoides]